MSYIITRPVKSRGVAALLIFLFGPLGMFYSTITGALIMIFVILPFVIWAALITSGLGLILVPFYYLACLIWAIQAANNHNRKIIMDSALINKNIHNQLYNLSAENSTLSIQNKKLEAQQDLVRIK